MLLQIKKRDLVNMCMGCEPSCSTREREEIKKLGAYNETENRWCWDKLAFNQLSMDETLDVYSTLVGMRMRGLD